MQKSVGIITFHAAHNYGSSLQAYAMQNIISDMGFNCEIINFRSERQKDQYTPLTKRIGIKYFLKNAYFLLNYKKRKKKYDLFETFIRKYLIKSPVEYASLEELEAEPPTYNYYVSGSDQIWNTVPRDADDAYFLPFVKEGKRIAYAPSFGQRGTVERKETIAEYLLKYDVLSVREKYAQKLVHDMIGKLVPLMPDPTLLLSRDRWDEIVPKRVVKGDYMFFYTLFATPEMIALVKRLSKKLDLPVIISNVSNQYEIFSGFCKETTTGPLEFLSLIKNASFVCTTSFHGTVFSILFQKPFFVIDGMSDNRISSLLELTGLEDREITVKDFENKRLQAYEIDFAEAHCKIEEAKKYAMDYLSVALEVEE